MNITKLVSIAVIAASCLPSLYAMENGFIPGASYIMLEQGESISNIVRICPYYTLFYTCDGNFIVKIEYHHGIEKMIDPKAPKPQPIKHTVLHYPDTSRYHGSPACMIIFYDKNYNEMGACVYNQETKILQIQDGGFSYDLATPHIIDAKFPLDLSRLKQK